MAITGCFADSKLSQLPVKPYGPILFSHWVLPTIVRGNICFGGGSAPKGEGGKKGEFAIEFPKRGQRGEGGEGGATSGRDALFQLHLLLRRESEDYWETKADRPKKEEEGNAVLCKLSWALSLFVALKGLELRPELRSRVLYSWAKKILASVCSKNSQL